MWGLERAHVQHFLKINISRIKDFRNEKQKEEPARKRNEKGSPKKGMRRHNIFFSCFKNKRHSGEIRAFWVECRERKENETLRKVSSFFSFDNHRSFSFFDVSLKNLVQPERTQTTHPTKR
jgi:hypothetical protein